MDAFFVVFEKVVIMVIMIAVGYILTKIGTLTEKGAGEITKILLNIVTPCLIISSFLSAESGSVSPISLILAAVLPLSSMIIAVLLSYTMFRKETAERKRVLRFSVVFGNVGFMGMPLVTSILGEEGVIFASFFIVMFNIFCWTYGYTMMSGEKKIKIKSILINPGTIGLVIGLPLYLLNVDLPEVINAPIGYFADLNTPLAMVIVGSNIAKVKFKEFLTDISVYKVALLRLFIAPAVFFLMLYLIAPEYNLFMSTAIQAATPAAANCVLFAMLFKQDSALASKTVAATTLFSIVTIPLMTMFAQILVNLHI